MGSRRPVQRRKPTVKRPPPEQHSPAMQAKIETSFLLDVTEPYGYPLIATANWDTHLALAVGRTAVFRSHFALPGALLRFDATGAARGITVPGAQKKVDAPPRDLGRVLVVLLTRSLLP